MNNKILAFVPALLALGFSAMAQSGPEDVIPVPAHYELSSGTTTVRNVKQKISKSFLKKVQQYELTDWQKASAYTLEITENGAKIEAADEQGAFYGMKTLEMLFSLSPEVKCCTITDWPRFRHRGLMIDVSRHFQPKDIIMKELEMMSKMKLNIFHFHLVDDPGWRIQIDKYPLLTEYAAWRPSLEWQDWLNDKQYCEWSDPRAYGGFYTKDDIREIVAFAAERFIEVIPEIEMPSHNYEAIAAYPELSCIIDGKHVTDVSEVCPGSEYTYTFLQNVLTEVFELFPSKYIHIGGDEANRSRWEKCSVCQERMKAEGTNSVEMLQSYLTERMEKFANEHGKTIIGWDEILEGKLAPNATVMSWRGTEGGIKAVKAGHDVIMAPTTYCYIDYHQAKDQYRAVGPYQPLENTYSYNPTDGMDPAGYDHILGVQGNMWTEFVRTWQHMEMMIYPRIFAIAETGWSQQEDKDYNKFRRSVIAWEKVIKSLGYNCYDTEHEVKE